jgi:S1-C subfamily serine protease
MNAVEWSNSLAQVVERVAPSVVRVEPKRGRSGSGTVWSADGLILTTAHRVDAESAIVVGLEDGSSHEASVVGVDPGTDLALLRVQGAVLQPLAFASGDSARVGHLAVALGRPGRGIRASLRMIGVIGADVRTATGGRLERYIESDRAIPRGFSGGPLVDLEGRAIGIDTSGLIRGADLAIPRETIERVVRDLLAHGSVRRGYLGVGAYPVRLTAAVAQQVGREHGALIVAVEEDSPAAAAGFLQGDVILDIEGAPVTGPGELRAVLYDRQDQQITVRVVRAGALKELTVKVGTRG